MIAFPLGGILVNQLINKKSTAVYFNDFLQKPIINLSSKKDSYVRYPLYSLTLVSVLAIIYTFVSIGEVPFLQIFNGKSSIELAILRNSAGREFAGNVYVRNFLGITITPILSFIAYAYWQKTKSKLDFFWWLILFIFSFLILTYNLEKTPFVTYLIGYLFLNVCIHGGISRSTLIKFFLVGFGLIVLAYVYIGGVTDYEKIFSLTSGIGGRMFLSQPGGVYLSFEYFPKEHSHIGFSSMSRFFSAILNMDYSERSSRILMEIINPKGIKQGTAGVVSSLFIAEAWSNFGIIGLILAPIHAGALNQIFYMLILRTKKTPIFLAFYCYLSYKSAIPGGFNEYLYSGFYIFLVSFLFIILFLVKYLKLIK